MASISVQYLRRNFAKSGHIGGYQFSIYSNIRGPADVVVISETRVGIKATLYSGTTPES